MENQTILVGCVHNDPRGEERLDKVLNRYLPRILTVEYDRERLSINSGQESFTVRTLQKYANSHGVSLHYIDDLWEQRTVPPLKYMEFMGKRMQRVNQQIDAYGGRSNVSPGILNKIINCPFLDLEKLGLEIEPDILYKIYLKHLEGEISDQEMEVYLDQDGQIFGESDVHMARKIREIVTGSEGPLLHAGGIFHIVQDLHRSSLFSQLTDLNPTRVPLTEADRMQI